MGGVEQKMRRSERRRAPRYTCAVDLEMEWGSALLRGRIRNISASGMFIESADPLWIGAGFSARIAAARSIRVNCSVRRIEPGKGMGVAVTVPESGSHEDFQAFLQSFSESDLPDDSSGGPQGSPPPGSPSGP
jgi:hypothetical protein